MCKEPFMVRHHKEFVVGLAWLLGFVQGATVSHVEFLFPLIVIFLASPVGLAVLILSSAQQAKARWDLSMYRAELRRLEDEESGRER